MVNDMGEMSERGFEIQSRRKADPKDLVNGQEVSLKETENNILSKIFFMCACEWRHIVEGFRNKSEIVRCVDFFAQG
jgi:hypothetical protein